MGVQAKNYHRITQPEVRQVKVCGFGFNNPVYVAKKKADAVSYFWDDLIEAFSFHVLNGTSEGRNWETPHEIEPGLRAMASTNRFQRRLLSQAFMEFYEKTEPGQREKNKGVTSTNFKFVW